MDLVNDALRIVGKHSGKAGSVGSIREEIRKKREKARRYWKISGMWEGSAYVCGSEGELVCGEVSGKQRKGSGVQRKDFRQEVAQ